MKKILAGLFFITVLISAAGAQNNNAVLQAFTRSYAYETEGNYPLAIQNLESVYQANSYPLNLRLGWLYYNQGDYFKSRDYYTRAVTLLPYSIEPKFGLALPQAALGNWEGVIQLYKDIIQIAPKQTVAHYRLAAIYYEQGHYEAAFTHAELVINLYPFDYDGLVLFAWINLKMGKTVQAQALFEQALLVVPEGTSAQEGLRTLKL